MWLLIMWKILTPQIRAEIARVPLTKPEFAESSREMPKGWCLIFAGSRFCIDAEHRYATIKSKAAEIAWVLGKCCMFVMGCPNLIVVTDHEPLKGLFGDGDLGKIQNPRLFRLKEKTLRYRCTIQHCPGKWHRASDAVSRNPATILQALLNVFPAEPSRSDVLESDDRRRGQFNNPTSSIWGKRQHSAHLTTLFVRLDAVTPNTIS